jgi:hypothetical protein
VLSDAQGKLLVGLIKSIGAKEKGGEGKLQIQHAIVQPIKHTPLH